MTLKKFELHLDVPDTDSTIIGLLSAACSLSTNELKQAIDKGALWHTVNKKTLRIRRIKKSLKAGEQLHFYYDEKVLCQTPTEPTLIADEKSYSIWNKPYGMLSQGSKWSDHCTIARWVEKTLERPCFIVHRLDRAASGLIIIAHAKKVTRQFGQLFEQHDLQKQYQIIVHGNFALSHQTQPLTVKTTIDNKSAKTIFAIGEYDPELDVSLVNVEIFSGRKHQIRIHSAQSGFPVVGDRLHGLKNHQYDETINLQLCAVKLSFMCPVEQSHKTFELPANLKPQLTSLQNSTLI
jgi:tRNA pseudouridine32 synthase / 23S rRNA pseudouridine746 synthase